MKINLKKTNIDLNPDRQAMYIEKLQESGRFFKDDEQSSVADLELGQSTRHHEHGDIYFAKVHISGPGRNYYAESEAENVESAFIDMKEKLIKEIRRDKEKQLSKRKKGGKIKSIFKTFRFK